MRSGHVWLRHHTGACWSGRFLSHRITSPKLYSADKTWILSLRFEIILTRATYRFSQKYLRFACLYHIQVQSLYMWYHEGSDHSRCCTTVWGCSAPLRWARDIVQYPNNIKSFLGIRDGQAKGLAFTCNSLLCFNLPFILRLRLLLLIFVYESPHAPHFPLAWLMQYLFS